MRRLPAAIFFGLLCLLVGSLSGSAGAQSEPLRLEDYWKLAGTTRLEVRTLEGRPDDEVAARLQTIAGRWQAIERVQLPDGSIVPLDHTELAERMRADPPDLQAIAARLEALQAAGAGWQAARFDAGDLDTLQAVLQRPEFQWETPQPSPLERLWEQIRRWLADLFERLFGGRRLPNGQPLLRWLLPALGTALVALALLYIFRELRLSVAGEAALEVEGGAQAEVATSNAAFQRALELSQGGDARSAVRYLFLSALLVLDERGKIRYDRTQTNRETLRSLKDQPELSAQLGEMVEVFDRVWYGYQPLDTAAFEQYVRHVETLREVR